MMTDMRWYITLVLESYFNDHTQEEYTTAFIQGYQVNIHWHKSKSASNKIKHGYNLDQAIHALDDSNAVTYLDQMSHEDRFRTICTAADRNIVTVIWSSVDTGEDLPTVRIIGMRSATERETPVYKNQNHGKSDSQISEQAVDNDIPEIPLGAKMVTQKSVMAAIVSKFHRNKKSERSP